MFPHKSLETVAKEMRALGEILVPHNYPTVSPEEEDDILMLKSQEVTFDGYSIIVFYSKSDYRTYHLETLQILGKNCPFLPFWLVVKIAKKFLGDNHLSLVEIFKEGKKIYCWSVVKNEDNISQPSPHKNQVKDCSYEGFAYKSMSPNQVNFY